MKKRTVTLISSAAAVLLLAGGGVAAAMNQPADEPVQKRTVSVVEETEPTTEPSAEPTVEPAPAEVPSPAPVVEPAPAPAPPPAPAGPIRCPAGSQANSSDGTNDLSCLPDSCYVGSVSNETHPQCVTAFKL